jgi:hypothetical protein
LNIFFGGQECVRHSFPCVAYFVFLKDVCIRTQMKELLNFVFQTLIIKDGLLILVHLPGLHGEVFDSLGVEQGVHAPRPLLVVRFVHLSPENRLKFRTDSGLAFSFIAFLFRVDPDLTEENHLIRSSITVEELFIK